MLLTLGDSYVKVLYICFVFWTSTKQKQTKIYFNLCSYLEVLDSENLIYWYLFRLCRCGRGEQHLTGNPISHQVILAQLWLSVTATFTFLMYLNETPAPGLRRVKRSAQLPDHSVNQHLLMIFACYLLGMGVLVVCTGIPVYVICVVWTSKPKSFIRIVGKFLDITLGKRKRNQAWKLNLLKKLYHFQTAMTARNSI